MVYYFFIANVTLIYSFLKLIISLMINLLSLLINLSTISSIQLNQLSYSIFNELKSSDKYPYYCRFSGEKIGTFLFIKYDIKISLAYCFWFSSLSSFLIWFEIFTRKSFGKKYKCVVAPLQSLFARNNTILGILSNQINFHQYYKCSLL